MEVREVDTVLGRVHVHISGAGEAMMFWPSLLMTGEMWAAQVDHFGAEHQVILVDPPGFGQSQKLTAPDVVGFVRDTVQRVDVRSGGWAVRSVVPTRPDQCALLRRVSTPVLVVAGVDYATFPLPETIAMAEAIPDAAIAVLEGVAHLAALENPAVVNKLIEEFVFRG
jgi:pimeloyl-ACP methyl ester carboxylesterase